MRSLIVVVCLIVAACADDFGYNYQPVRHSDAGPGDINYGSASNVAPSFNAQHNLPSATNEASVLAPQPVFEKEFFTYAASEDDFSDPAASNQYENSVKQGLRVIFIKGPENNGVENAAVTLAKQVNDQKTAIYVLQKQTDFSNLANNLNIANHNNNNRPEVHFVKYRTPEDADNAQKAIQNQYDSLSGPSKLYNGGVASVLNFASNTPASTNNQNVAVPHPAASHDSISSSYIPPASAVDEPNNTYLPPSILRLFRL